MKKISIKRRNNNSLNRVLFFGYFQRHNFCVLRLKHDVIIETEPATSGLTLAYNLRMDTTVCVSDKKICDRPNAHTVYTFWDPSNFEHDDTFNSALKIGFIASLICVIINTNKIRFVWQADGLSLIFGKVHQINSCLMLFSE